MINRENTRRTWGRVFKRDWERDIFMYESGTEGLPLPRPSSAISPKTLFGSEHVGSRFLNVRTGDTIFYRGTRCLPRVFRRVVDFYFLLARGNRKTNLDIA